VAIVLLAGFIVVVAVRRRPAAAAPRSVVSSEATLPRVLVAPPSVPVTGGSVTIPEYLKRYHPRGETVLMEAVNELYRRAGTVPAVADYLRDADMAALPRHFHSVLVMLTTRGLTAPVARQLRNSHAGVRNSRGEPITPAIFGAVVGVLVDVLTEAGVPEAALAQVGEMAVPLEEVICGAAAGG
jgi:hypothetical protein